MDRRWRRIGKRFSGETETKVTRKTESEVPRREETRDKTRG